MPLRLGLAVIAAASVATPAAAELRPSSPEEIALAVSDCWMSVNATAVDEAALRSKGWEAGSLQTPEGKPVPAAITFLSKKGSNALLMLSKTADPRGCMVMSRVSKVGEISLTVQAVLRQLKSIDPKVEGKKASRSEVAYFSLPKAALLRPSGTKEKPGTVIQVSYTAPEKK